MLFKIVLTIIISVTAFYMMCDVEDEMSRSRKKPYHSTTCSGDRAGVQKKWKKQCNKRVRQEQISDGSAYKRVCDPWSAPNDGKHYWDDEKGTRK